MSETMLERVMRAIADLGSIDLANYQHRELVARAAIQAMLQPTKEMVVAGDNAKEECIDHGYDSDADGNRYDYTTINSDLPAIVFRAMIDAALSPSQAG